MVGWPPHPAHAVPLASLRALLRGDEAAVCLPSQSIHPLFLGEEGGTQHSVGCTESGILGTAVVGVAPGHHLLPPAGEDGLTLKQPHGQVEHHRIHDGQDQSQGADQATVQDDQASALAEEEQQQRKDNHC
jgi:hypothetical protein